MEVWFSPTSRCSFPNNSYQQGPYWGSSTSGYLSGSLSYRARKHIMLHSFSVPLSPATRTMRHLLGQTESLPLKQNRCKVFRCHNQEISVLEARSIDEIYDALTERLLPTSSTMSNPNSKYIVGLAGPPGAGKTTLASEVVRRLNALWPQKAPKMDSSIEPMDVAIVIPMDGFHLYRSQLDAMENPEEAHARRGAPWTFDPARLLTSLTTLRKQGTVYVPSFDHGVGDPIEDDIFVTLQHRLVIVEGNYLLLDDGLWKQVSSLFDEKWFLDIDINTSMQRVLKRHISTGKAPDIAKWRVEYNDRPNAELIEKSKKNADLEVLSTTHTYMISRLRHRSRGLRETFK